MMPTAIRKKVLVTGSAGLLGSYAVVALLAQGHSVRAMYHNRIPDFAAQDNLELFKGDILDVFDVEDAMKDIDVVFHCAGMVSYQASDAAKIYKINVDGTANIVNRALESGIEKLIHVSSVAALAKLPEEKFITEKMNWISRRDASTYGHSKFLGEMEVWRAMAEGLAAVIVNPSIIIGAGNWEEGSTKIFKTIHDGFPWYSTGVNGFVAASDVVKVMLLLMNDSVVGERYIVSQGNHSYKEIFTYIASGFNTKAPHKAVTPFLAKLVVLMSWLKQIFTGAAPLITKETTATALSVSLYDHSKLLHTFPNFKYEDIEVTVASVCLELKQNLNKH